MDADFVEQAAVEVAQDLQRLLLDGYSREQQLHVLIGRRLLHVVVWKQQFCLLRVFDYRPNAS